MHYIEYIPGTIARITDRPTRHGHEDVNLLSRWVSKFNNTMAAQHSPIYTPSTSSKVTTFVIMMQRFQLPCSS